LTRTEGQVALVGAGPGDPELWTVRALKRVQEADLVLYDALVDAEALRRLTSAQCFCVGKRAGRASVTQDTIDRLMIRAAKQGKRVVRLKGGDPFVFGRGAEEALALAHAGIPFEVVPGVTTAVAAPELAGIPVTHRGVASAFLVLAGQTGDALDATLDGIRPHSVTLVWMMGLAHRGELVSRLIAHGWSGATRAAIVCGASTAAQWTWTGRLADVDSVAPPEGSAGVVVVGEVVQVREALSVRPKADTTYDADEVKYGRS
jgi:uroporphyrin-III C-methyltransferase/precorrin-2 dehydrogenase/sirohydrochlorin ferrochelatase